MSSSNYLIAVDGGGTKTEFCFYEIPTGKKSYIKSGSTNYKTAGDRITENNLVKAMTDYMEKYSIAKEQIKGIVVGIAGCDNEGDKNYYQELLEKTGIDDSYIYICNDAHLAFGSSGGRHGIVVVAGTGTICLGIKRNGDVLRCGGWGYPISDLGSGLWLASEALKELTIFCDGYGIYHSIFENFKEKIGAKTFDEIPQIITSYKISDIASFAKIIMDFADKGDEYCVNLCRKSIRHVIDITKNIYRKLSLLDKENMDFVIAGGLFSHTFFKNEYLNCLKEEIGICDDVVKQTAYKPVDGGINIAKQIFISL